MGKREVRSSQREMDRELRELDRQEKQITKELKQRAKLTRNSKDPALAALAKQLVQVRKQKEKNHDGQGADRGRFDERRQHGDAGRGRVGDRERQQRHENNERNDERPRND